VKIFLPDLARKIFIAIMIAFEMLLRITRILLEKFLAGPGLGITTSTHHLLISTGNE